MYAHPYASTQDVITQINEKNANIAPSSRRYCVRLISTGD